MKLLVDTCAFLWIVGGGGALPPRVREAFVSPENDVYFSAVSAWEIALKYAAGKLPLPEVPEKLVPVERERRGMTALPLDEESALHVLRLPPLHRDPFDRMLVSQAIVHGLVILTPDRLVSQYPARTMW
jgi:PIN domain nuclease of toxin-antitoxin system